MIEWIVENLEGGAGGRDDLHRHQRQIREPTFKRGPSGYEAREGQFKFKIVNDGSTSDDDKLGAIGDINLALTRENLTERRPVDHCRAIISSANRSPDSWNSPRENEATVAVYDVGSLEAIKKYAGVTLDGEGVIQQFEEKPAKPTSTLAAIALYYYSREVLASDDDLSGGGQ